jgi:hypothetical protein
MRLVSGYPPFAQRQLFAGEHKAPKFLAAGRSVRWRTKLSGAGIGLT